MPHLIVAHRSDDGPALDVRGWQAIHVTREMLLDLPLGLDDEAEVRAISRDPRGQPECERTGIPERIDEARSPVELGETLLRPGEMLFLFARRVGHAAARCAVPRGEGLRLIKRLRTDLAGVIDAHQSDGVTPLLRTEIGLGHAARGIGTAAGGDAGQGSQRAVEREDQIVEHPVEISVGRPAPLLVRAYPASPAVSAGFPSERAEKNGRPSGARMITLNRS